MIVRFEKEYLRELYETEKTTYKKYRFQPQVVSKYIIEFTTTNVNETEAIITVCNIIELSNHYK